MRGASASADHIQTEVGGNLLIESLKDKIKYDSQQTSVGGGVSLCIPPICYGQMVVVSVNAAESTTKADHDSVAAADEQRGQSGLKAGNGGFDVKVVGNTDLKGGVIAATVAAEKNTLTTGTLTFSDIANHSETEAHSDAVSLSSSMVSSGYGAAKDVAENLAAHAVASKSEDSATRSAVSAGTLTITDQDAQTQDVAHLSRDTANTHRGLELIDRQALQKEVEVRREIQSMTVKTVEFFTDEAHRVMFKVTPKILKVTCRQEPCAYGGEGTADANRKIIVDGKEVNNIAFEEVKPWDIPKDGSARIAINGISNDEQRAAELAMQNTPLDRETKSKPTEIYVVYYQQSNNVASELIVAAYEKHMAKTFGYTNPDVVSAALIQQQGDNAVLVEGHSRGSLVVDNALTILKDGSHTNNNLSINVYGPAVNQQKLETSFSGVNNSEDAKPNYFYQTNDPVSTVVGDAKDGLFIPSLLEFWNVIMTNNSAHSCYGTGAPGCKPFQTPPATSVNGQ